MYIFILLVVIILLFAGPLFKNAGKLKARKNYLIKVGLFFVLIAGLRDYNVGLDTGQYLDFFRYDSASDLSYIIRNTRFEILFVCVCYLVKILTGSFTVLLIIAAATHIFGAFKLLYDHSSIIWLGCLFFFLYGFYYRDFNEIRQAMAIGVACLSFNYLLSGNWLKYFLVIALATGFHYSALIMAPLFFINRIKTINTFWLCLIASLIMIMFSLSLLMFNYMNSVIVNEFNAIETTGGWGLLIMQIFTLVLGYLNKKSLCENRNNLCAYYMIAYSAILFPLCHVNPTLFRLEQYSWLFMIVFLPNLLHVIKQKSIRYTLTLLYIGAGVFLSITNYYTENNQILPYNFVWE